MEIQMFSGIISQVKKDAAEWLAQNPKIEDLHIVQSAVDDEDVGLKVILTFVYKQPTDFSV